MLWSADGPTPLMALALLVSLGAGVVRGFAGFGFSALVVVGLSLFMAPAPVVPAVMLLEVVASSVVWRSAVQTYNAAWLQPLVLGNLVCVPLGMWLLAHLDPVLLRLVLGAALLLCAVTLRWCSARAVPDTLWVRGATGAFSGFLTGLAGSGGVAAALMMAACHVQAAALRGTMVVFLVFAALYTVFWAGVVSQSSAARVDLFSLQTLQWVALLAPGMLLGIVWGGKAFSRANPARFRVLVINLLIVTSALSVLRAGFELSVP